MQHGKRGFTLVELMVVVAISAIALGIAVPAFQSVIQRNQSDSVAMGLAAAINLAREEAIRTRGVAAVCPRTTTQTGEPYCANSADWSHGWLVLTLPASAGSISTCPTGSNTYVVRAFDAPDPNAQHIRVSANGAQRTCVRFGATGLTANNLAGMTFTVAFPGESKATCLIMSRGGRLRRDDRTGVSCDN